MSTGDHGEPPYELTRNPVDSTYGFICREHALHRSGLTHQHAVNVEAKHVREHHADPLEVELDLTEAASAVIHYRDQGSMSVWQALTGLTDYNQALTFAELCAVSETPVRAAVVPL